MNNENTRRAEAYDVLLKTLENADIPIAQEIARAIHLDWADNASYEETVNMSIDQLKELLQDFETNSNIIFNRNMMSDEQYSKILAAFLEYLRKKEGLNTQGGKRKKRSTRRHKKKRQTRRRR